MSPTVDARERWIRKLLSPNGLPFRDFVEAALYDPELGYYAAPKSGRDYATSVDLSPVFAFALSRLAAEFSARAGDAVSTLVDIGCGDGSLLASLREFLGSSHGNFLFYGVDRSLARLRPELASDPALRFVRDLAQVPDDRPTLVLSNELFDAFPFARLVRRDDGLREMWVVPREEGLDWDERPAPPEYADYFARRGVTLETGQFADVSLEWETAYARIARRFARGLLVTIDYGFPRERLYDVRVRRYGTAVAFHRHQLTRDLLARPGEQDLTAHVDLTDLAEAGEGAGWRTVTLARQARFLLALGATEHPLLAPLEEVRPAGGEDAVELAAMRDAARRLVLPEGIGEEMRVLVQEQGMGHEPWPFESDAGRTSRVTSRL